MGNVGMASHPPALREAVFHFDEHGSIDATGLPVCGRQQIERRVTGPARHACRKAIVGHGVAHVAVAAAEPTQAAVRLTLFNGGTAGGVTRLLTHGTIALSEPLPVVVPVKIEKAEQGRYGLRSITRIPQLLEGAASLLDFRLKIGRRFEYKGTERSYLTARCVDGRLSTRMTAAVFKREADGSRTKTVMSGTVIRPCTPIAASPRERSP